MNLFDLTLKIKGFPIKKAKAKLTEIQIQKSKNFSDYIEQSRWNIFNYHRENNEFYKKFLNGKSVEKWEDIPVLSKKELQRPIAELITSKFKGNNYTSKTSGSSGTPLFFCKDKFAHALTWAEIFRLYESHGINYGKSLQARFYAIPLEGIKYYIERFKDYLSGRYRFIIHDMSDNKLEGFLKTFKKKKFEYLYGYTNSLVLFARYLIKNGIVLKDVCPTIKVCVVTSEVCTPEDRELLRKGFGVYVVNEYGASEIGLIAFENKKMEWTVLNESLFVEVLDKSNNVLPYGEVGKIVITCFYNKAMPFIRYEVGDYGAIQHKGDGSCYLQQLYGRLNDVLYLPNGKVIPGFTLYYVTKAMMEKIKGIKEYNIRQTATDEIAFDIVTDVEIDLKAQKEISNIVKNYLGDEVTSLFNRVTHIERLKSGKMKHFQAFKDSISESSNK